MIPQKNPLIASGESVHANMLTKLWENPNPSASFSAQTINLASNDYDLLLTVYAPYSGRVDSTIVTKGSNMFLNLTTGYRGNENIRSRALNYVSDTQYSAQEGKLGQAAETTDNSACIPLIIYGFKKSLDITAIVSNISTDARLCMLSDGVTSVEDKLNNLANVKLYKVSGTTGALNTEITIPFPAGADASKLMIVGYVCRNTISLYYSDNSDIKIQSSSNLGVRVTVTGSGFVSQPITVLLAEI